MVWRQPLPHRVFNAYTLLLCEECEFVCILRNYLPAVLDEKLRVQAKSWLGEEASHGVQHRKACVTLAYLELRYRDDQRVINFFSFRMLFSVLNKSFRISLAAGLEHCNTMIDVLLDPHGQLRRIHRLFLKSK